MQIINTFGFTIEYNEKDSDKYYKYLELKDAIERLCYNSEIYSKTNNKNPLVQFSRIKKGFYITCAVLNGQANFGIYQEKYKNILQHASSNILDDITIHSIKNLQNRMEITANNPMIITVNPFQQAWLELFKEKRKQADTKISYDIER